MKDHQSRLPIIVALNTLVHPHLGKVKVQAFKWVHIKMAVSENELFSSFTPRTECRKGIDLDSGGDKQSEG
jgi:hypothetical protein